ncbi:TPR domain-containing glycosyltransferase [Caldicellulosiruptor morganii]|uniref:Glycosyltransferase n=2 Tax=Caldicellulosiruptor morganii TaxID=1387555 RepID=A0ABY7BKN1_9FIRM|nr:TPR domain-containing glycosyltransferase [Caldicellulosiruptor morganii]WAM33050.1 glycosyltransferase [Caldicellulosiruptor morganii]
MIVKDEEKNLPRCLDSLKELTENKDVELIIVDTGSADKTVEIAKRYTEKVYFYEWKNDFSAARNFSISKAQGEWIFIIDADEELRAEDGKILYNFLCSKESKDYNTITILVKNLLDIENDNFSIVASERLFRNDGTFCYEGFIHNLPKSKGPVKHLDVMLIHYGYISTDNELVEKKFKRTSALLKKKLEEEPENIYYLYQLSASYLMHKDYKEALEVAEKAYELMQKRIPFEFRVHFLFLYQHIVKCYIANNEIDKAFEVCDEGIKLEPEFIDLYYYRAKINLMKKRENYAIKDFISYLKLLEKFSDLKITKNPSVELFTVGLKDEVYMILAKLYKEKEEYDKALSFACKVRSKSVIDEALKLIIRICFENVKIEDLFAYYQQLKKESNEWLDKIIANIEFNLLERNNEKLFLSYSEVFMKDDSLYGALNNVRFDFIEGKLENAKKILQMFFEKENFDMLPFYYADIIYYSLVMKLEVLSIIEEISNDKWIVFVEYLAKKYFESIEEWITALESQIEKFGENINIFLKKLLLYHQVLNVYYEKKIDIPFERVFNSYIDTGIQYIEKIYREEILEKNPEIIRFDNDRFFAFVRLIIREHDLEKRKEYVRKAVEIYPYMADGIKKLIEKSANKVADSKFFNAEFEMYKNVVKNKIKGLVDQGFLEEAERLVDEYEKLVKSDPDIYSLRAMIKINKRDFASAVSLLKNGLKLYPEDDNLNYNLGYVYELMGDDLKALEQYRKLLNFVKDKEIEDKIVYLQRKLYRNLN